MNEQVRQDRYALFRCEYCEIHWPGVMPSQEDDWPTCERCGSLASLLWALVPEFMYRAEILHQMTEFLAS